jgi:hypothetical protein
MNYRTHNPYDESHWVNRLRENLMSGSDGEGLETGRLVPRQSFTRQLFFKWLKQHLKIKSFWGVTTNAVKTQIYCAIIAYCLVAVVGYKLKVNRTIYEILQILSISLLDKSSIREVLTKTDYNNVKEQYFKQLKFNGF